LTGSVAADSDSLIFQKTSMHMDKNPYAFGFTKLMPKWHLFVAHSWPYSWRWQC